MVLDAKYVAMNKEQHWLLREKYHGVKSDAFDADCARLEAGEPLAYLIGSIPFLNCTIHLDSHPLIPRPETEFWTEKAIVAIQDYLRHDRTSVRGLASNLDVRGPTPKILDLCAGSGAIGVAVAKAIPEATVTFAEIDPTHLPTIEKNLTENLSIGRKVAVVASDLFSNVTGTFDFIVTNPPYIDAAANTVALDVEAHEPHLALFGGVAGMEIITRIISSATTHLAPAGQLWIEHEPFQSLTIKETAAAHDFTCTTAVDQYGTERYSILTRATL